MRTKRTADWKTVLAAAALCVAIAGCGDGDDGTQVEEPVATTVEISPESATLTFINAMQGFTAVVRDQNGKAMSNATVSWSGSDAAVFALSPSGSSATVEAVGNGSATLTATSGQASGTASVEVEQVATRLEMVSGDEQEALRGNMLPEPLVVRVDDQGGTAAAGVSVTFLPDEGSGSVSETMVETGADGLASTEWTLGDLRRQSVLAFVGELTFEFRAAAMSDPPIPDLMFNTVTLSRNDPTVLETVDVMAEILNGGDGATPATFMLGVTVDGQMVETVEVDGLEPDATGTVEFALGPFSVGRHAIDLMLDPDGELDEWGTDNNSASETIIVVDQKLISLGESVEVSSATTGPVLLYRVEVDEASDEALNVKLSGGTGDADLFAHYAERPGHQYEYRCFSGNQDANEDCQLVPTRAGTYYIAVHAFSAFGPSTLEVTIGGQPVEPFDLEVEFVGGGTDSQRNIVMQAAQRWESVLTRDLNWDANFTTNPAPAGACGPNSPQVSDVVDDLRVFVDIDSIDGAGGAIGASGYCYIRRYPFTGATGYLQPILSAVILDEDDVAQMESAGVLLSVVTHELAHALGFTADVWALHNRLQDPSLPNKPGADTHFLGPLAIAAFDAVGGTGYAGAKVPVENGAEPGSSDSHWRESVFGHELMTPYLTGSSQPLSLVTIESLYDLGYETDPNAADEYTLSSAGMMGMAIPVGPVIDLSNDILRIPVRVVEIPRKGRK